jgi:hypothetical protein
MQTLARIKSSKYRKLQAKEFIKAGIFNTPFASDLLS